MTGAGRALGGGRHRMLACVGHQPCCLRPPFPCPLPRHWQRGAAARRGGGHQGPGPPGAGVQGAPIHKRRCFPGAPAALLGRRQMRILTAAALPYTAGGCARPPRRGEGGCACRRGARRPAHHGGQRWHPGPAAARRQGVARGAWLRGRGGLLLLSRGVPAFCISSLCGALLRLSELASLCSLKQVWHDVMETNVAGV